MMAARGEIDIGEGVVVLVLILGTTLRRVLRGLAQGERPASFSSK